METLLMVQAFVEILVGLVTLGGVLWGGWKLIIKPIKTLITNTEKQTKELANIRKTQDEIILPVINSLEKEFSKNGGKSIKDQINKINESVSLAELRSKMIASNLITTGSYECDAQGEVTWVNKAMCEMFGLSFEECLGNGWLSGIVGVDRADIWKNWREVIELDIPYEAEYVVHNHHTNKKLRVRSTAVPHKSVDGKILGFYGTIVKLSEL